MIRSNYHLLSADTIRTPDFTISWHGPILIKNGTSKNIAKSHGKIYSFENKIKRLINDEQNEIIDKVEHAADVMEISDKIEEYSWYENDHDTMKDDF